MIEEPELLEIFKSVYGYSKDVIITNAPGRVNIIGEHTDYNEGYVFPTPISNRVWLAASPRSDETVGIYASDYDQWHEFSLDKIVYSAEHRWANYVMGVVYALIKKGFKPQGANIVIKGDVPQGAGLSSSAALEVAAARAFRDLFDLDISPVELAYLGKTAENDFVGVKSGIMDQFVASLGEPGNALLIDCRNNNFKKVPIPNSLSLVAVHTGIRRKLTTSAYNERVSQCLEGVSVLAKNLQHLRSLRDFTMTDLEDSKSILSEMVYRRCRHVISENERVLKSVDAAQKNDGVMLGKLMNESHMSLRDDYEVSCRELDCLVDISKSLGYVYGARLTGAGFGGCTINLMPKHMVDEFSQTIVQRYLTSTGLRAEVYSVQQ